MSMSRSALAIFALATGFVAGVYAYPGLQPVSQSAVALVEPSAASRDRPAAGGVVGLRRWATETAAETAAAAQRTAEASEPTEAILATEALGSTPEVNAPLPPRRPPELTAGPDLPLPPRRPADLPAAGAPPAVAPESASAAAEQLVNAPQPPSRPRELAATPTPATQPAPPAPSGQQTATAAAEPTLRPAPDSSFENQPPLRFNEGAPAYVRIFKKESELELWLKVNGRYSLYRTFPICKWSGRLGPKVREADYQSPEGFYSVSAKQLNPHSNYHLAFNVGYPNAFDKQNGRTGGLVMVHGACKSVGCFAMTDPGVEEIYRFVAAALAGGQREVPVHIFPFRMSEAAIERETASGGILSFLATESSSQQWSGFWRNLKEGYDIFERTGEPPTAYACGDHYAFGGNGASCPRIAGW
ncbi:MAG TPA: murein L,D-transpeptidase family protein [Methylocystis sp.]|nr:murein L,D-transpeptidase family protein [Methylocystis sp.]